MLEKVKELSLQAKLIAACAAVVVLIGGVFAVASIAGSGTDYASKCQESVESSYGYSDDSQGEEIEGCVEIAESWEEQGVSEEEINNQLGLP